LIWKVVFANLRKTRVRDEQYGKATEKFDDVYHKAIAHGLGGARSVINIGIFLDSLLLT